MTMRKLLVSESRVAEADDGYPELEHLISSRVAKATGNLFSTSAAGRLFDLFLAGLPSDRRQHYNCNHCRHFVERFGHLVTINDVGRQESVLWNWDNVPLFFASSLMRMREAVNLARVTGVFLSSDLIWGVPFNVAGPGSKCVGTRWSHLSGTNPSVFKGVKTASQMMAEKLEDFGLLCQSLADYRRDVIIEAVRVLEADALDRSEKALGIGQWFLETKTIWENEKGQTKTNLLWRAVATAPPGFCHVKNTVIGTLLEDIAAGMDYDAVRRRWAQKLHPLQYQRPQALSTGNIEAAEKLIEKLGAARSLERRFARLDEVVSIWRPLKAKEQAGGVFGHLRESVGNGPVKPLALPPKKTTWVKFSSEVLPDVKQVELFAPMYGNYYGMTAAVHADAPPILQWDGEPRNTCGWYLYAGGSSATNWNLAVGWVNVSSIHFKPPHWYSPDKFAHQGWSIMFALKGARDLRHTAGGGLFPETLLAQFREARAAIEAYTKKAAIVGRDEGNANGITFDRGSSWDCRLRVTTDVGSMEYVLDRWE